MLKNSEKTMNQIVTLCKGRGFVYPGSEIYGGLSKDVYKRQGQVLVCCGKGTTAISRKFLNCRFSPSTISPAQISTPIAIPHKKTV